MGTTQECCMLFWTNPGSMTPTKQQLYGHSLLISQTTQVRWTKYTKRCWWSKDELISDILPWTLTHGCTNVGWPTKTSIHMSSVWTLCRLEDQPRLMTREGQRNPVGMPWWSKGPNKESNGSVWDEVQKEKIDLVLNLVAECLDKYKPDTRITAWLMAIADIDKIDPTWP